MCGEFFNHVRATAVCKSRGAALRRVVGTACLTWAAGGQAAAPLVVESVVLQPVAEAEIPARAAGVLIRVAAAEGARVEPGQLLATLDARRASIALKAAEAERNQVAARAANELKRQYADKALEVARAELARSQESIAQYARSVSQSQIDVERLTVEKLELERRQAEHELRLEQFELARQDAAVAAAKLELELHAVRAPFAGVVALVRGRVGEWVQPGAAVLRLVGVDALRAEGFVGADAAPSALVGAPAELVVERGAGAPPRRYRGVLKFVSPEIDPVARQVRVWAEIDNADGELRVGEQGRLEITPGESAAPTETASGVRP